MPTNYQFRTGQALTAVALRRQELMEHQAQIRERVSFGKQELEAMDLALKMTQEEQKIKNDIVSKRQTALATQAVSKLDPEKDPDWRQKYAEIMSDFPYAKDDKFLNDNFKQLGEVYHATLDAKIKATDEDHRAKIKETEDARAADLKVVTSGEIEKQRRTTHDAEQTSNMLHAAAQKGVDLSPFVQQDEDGNVTHDWSGIASASAKAKASTPTPGIIEQHAKVSGDLVAQTEYQKSLKPDDPNFKASQAKIAGYAEQLGILKTAYPSLSTKPDASQDPNALAEEVLAQRQPGQAAPKPVATTTPAPAAMPQPSATPKPAPYDPNHPRDLTPEEIQIVKKSGFDGLKKAQQTAPAAAPSPTPDSRPPLDDIFK
jgi:hypothetical protein